MNGEKERKGNRNMKKDEKDKDKTYNSRYSLLATHPTTNLPLWSLWMQSGRDGRFSRVCGRMCGVWGSVGVYVDADVEVHMHVLSLSGAGLTAIYMLDSVGVMVWEWGILSFCQWRVYGGEGSC